MLYPIQSEKIIFVDEFAGQWSGAYQALNTGSINRLWRAISGKDGVLELQVNNGHNTLRHNPNSLYLDSRTLYLAADVAAIRSSGTQQFYFGLTDKHLGELPITNGVLLTASTSDNLWRGQSYKGGTLVDTGVVGTLFGNSIFQSLKIELNSSRAIVTVGTTELPLTFTRNYAVGLMFGMVNTGSSWPSMLVDWVKLWR